MGATASVDSLSPEDLGKGVASLGKAYEAYNQAVVDEGISGEVLFETVREDENLFRAFVAETLNVEKQHHQTAMYKRYVKLLVAGEGQKDVSSTKSPLEDLIALAKTIVVKDITVNDADLHDCFLSYRQKTEKQFSTILFSGVKALAVDEEFAYPGCKPKLFLDTKSLRDGEDWEGGFVRGLLSSLMMVPLVSWHEGDEGSVAQMIGFSEVNDYQDNVLLEWELALALLEWDKSMLKAIFPVLIADKDNRGFLDFRFQHFNKLSTLPSLKTKQKLVSICLANGIPLSEKAVRRSVKDVVTEITQNQGVKMSELGAENIAMSTCEKRVFDKAAELARFALDEHGIGKTFVSKDSSAAVISAATAEIAAMRAKADLDAKEIKAKAEREIAEMKAKAESDRTQHMPAKATVRIDGTTGPYAGNINGMYEVTTEMSGDMPVYVKVGDREMWLEFRAADKKWQVKTTIGKGSDRGWGATCVVPVKCLPQDCPVGEWQVGDYGKWGPQPAVTILPVVSKMEVEAYLAQLDREAARVVKCSQSLRISGATGGNANAVNGVYRPTEELRDNATVYVKEGDGNRWLEYNAATKTWQLKRTEHKGQDNGVAYCYVPVKCLPQDCPVGQWQVGDVTGWGTQPAVTIKIVDGTSDTATARLDTLTARLNCPKRHPLAPVTRPSGYICDVCKKHETTNGTKSNLCCLSCDYDVCDECASVSNRKKGTRGAGLGLYYCGRRLGTSAIPDSDGQCGPNDGPQCKGCQAYFLAIVHIQWATGTFAGNINGMFEATTEVSGDMEAYANRGNDDLWLEYRAVSKKWQVKQSHSKGSDRCWAQCGVPAKCLPQDCPVGQWQVVVTGTQYDPQPAITISAVTPEVLDLYIAEAKREAALVLKGSHKICIAGATGNNAGIINGIYKPTEEICGNVTVYVMEGNGDRWLEYHAPTKTWQAKQATQKGIDDGQGICYVPAKCLPQHCPVGQWIVADGGKAVKQSGLTVSEIVGK